MRENSFDGIDIRYPGVVDRQLDRGIVCEDTVLQ